MFQKLNRFTLYVLLLTATSNQAFGNWLPPQEFPTIGSAIAVASDANGHAFAVYSDELFGGVKASYFSGGIWSLGVEIGAGETPSAIALDMDDRGTAMAFYYDRITGEISASYFDLISWTVPIPTPIEVISVASTGGVAVSMNGPATAAALWIDSVVPDVRTAFFSGGVWNPILSLGAGTESPSIAYSPNGTALAAWINAGTAVVANYNGVSWQAPLIVDAGPLASDISVGIDNNGNGVAVWLNGTGNVFSRTFSGGVWQSAVSVSGTSGNFHPSLAVAGTGTAVATWVDASSLGQSSAYNGNVWSSPFPFSGSFSVAQTVASNVSVDNFGNALVVFATTVPEIRSARLPLGGIWAPVDFLMTSTKPDIASIDTALSSNGIGFAVWMQKNPDDEFYDLFADATDNPLPPSSINGSVCKNNFAAQTDRINVISWTASTDPDVVAYYLRRDGVLIAVIPASGPFVYLDHNQCAKNTRVYTLTTIDAFGAESLPIFIEIR